jgi:hypothetical protein
VFRKLWLALLLVLVLEATYPSPFAAVNNGEPVNTTRHRFCSTCLTASSSSSGYPVSNLQEAPSAGALRGTKSWRQESNLESSAWVKVDLQSPKRVVMVSVQRYASAPPMTLNVSAAEHELGPWTTLATGPMRDPNILSSTIFDMYTPNVNRFRYLYIQLVADPGSRPEPADQDSDLLYIGLNELMAFTGIGDPADGGL